VYAGHGMTTRVQRASVVRVNMALATRSSVIFSPTLTVTILLHVASLICRGLARPRREQISPTITWRQCPALLMGQRRELQHNAAHPVLACSATGRRGRGRGEECRGVVRVLTAPFEFDWRIQSGMCKSVPVVPTPERQEQQCESERCAPNASSTMRHPRALPPRWRCRYSRSSCDGLPSRRMGGRVEALSGRVGWVALTAHVPPVQPRAR